MEVRKSQTLGKPAELKLRNSNTHKSKNGVVRLVHYVTLFTFFSEISFHSSNGVTNSSNIYHVYFLCVDLFVSHIT